MPRKQKDDAANLKIHFCFDCQTDLRKANYAHHKEMGHLIKEYEKDPRLKGLNIRQQIRFNLEKKDW